MSARALVWAVRVAGALVIVALWVELAWPLLAPALAAAWSWVAQEVATVRWLRVAIAALVGVALGRLATWAFVRWRRRAARNRAEARNLAEEE